jgi:hypothetical protein
MGLIKGARIATLAALLAASPLAQADTHALASSGSWRAFGGTTNSGRPVCGVSMNVEDRYFGVKYFSGEPTFTIQMGTGAWTVSNGEKIAVRMTFDTQSPWNASGTGMHFSDGDAGVEFDIQQGQLDAFLREFRGSARLRLEFPNRGVADWQLALAGVSVVSEAMQDCVKKIR